MRIRTFIIVCSAAFFAAAVAHAENGFVPLASSEQSPMLQAVYSSTSLGQYVNILFKVALSAGAILAVIKIAYAGYLYMGSDLWGNKQKAKEILGDVTLGLLLLLSIFLILNQINPQLLNLDVLGSSSAQNIQQTGGVTN